MWPFKYISNPLNAIASIGQQLSNTTSNFQQLLNLPTGQATISTLFACSYLIPMSIEITKSENPLVTIEQLITNLQSTTGVGLTLDQTLNVTFTGLGFYYGIQSLFQANMSEFLSKLYSSIELPHIKQYIEKFEHVALAVSNIQTLIASYPEQLKQIQRLMNNNHNEDANTFTNMVANILPIIRTLYLIGMLIYHVKAVISSNAITQQKTDSKELINLEHFLKEHKQALEFKIPDTDSTTTHHHKLDITVSPTTSTTKKPPDKSARKPKKSTK